MGSSLSNEGDGADRRSRSCATCVYGAASAHGAKRRCCHPGALFPGQFLTGPEPCEGYRARPFDHQRLRPSRRTSRGRATSQGNFAYVHALVH